MACRLVACFFFFDIHVDQTTLPLDYGCASEGLDAMNDRLKESRGGIQQQKTAWLTRESPTLTRDEHLGCLTTVDGWWNWLI